MDSIIFWLHSERMRLTLILLLFAFSAAIAQVPISPALEAAFAEEDRWLPLRLQLNSHIDWAEVQAQWEADKVPVTARPSLVNRMLMKQAAIGQKELKQYLASFGPDQLRDLRSFYLVNMIVAHQLKTSFFKRSTSLDNQPQIHFDDKCLF